MISTNKQCKLFVFYQKQSIYIIHILPNSCIESIISERMRQISDTLNDIDILDTACHTASSRLSSIRHSKVTALLLN